MKEIAATFRMLPSRPHLQNILEVMARMDPTFKNSEMWVVQELRNGARAQREIAGAIVTVGWRREPQGGTIGSMIDLKVHYPYCRRASEGFYEEGTGDQSTDDSAADLVAAYRRFLLRLATTSHTE